MVKSSDNFKFRAYFLCFFFLLLSGLLIGRLFFIQVSGHSYYLARAERQFTSYQTKPSISVRGTIYFKDKSGIAAAVKDGYLAALKPSLINGEKEAEKICEEAERILGVKKDSCILKAMDKKDPFEIISHRLSEKKAEEIIEMSLAGLGAYPEQWRFYPANSLASQVLGFVGYKGDELVGRYGVEQFYEDVLKGKKEKLSEGNSFAMLFWELGKDILSTGAAGGHDIVLTIEPQVQSFLEDALDLIMEDWKGTSAGGIIMDPKTGAIIAMSSKPDFEPNKYNEVDDISYFRNPLVSNIFELGSVFKPLTLAASMDQGKITAKTIYVDNGFLVLDGRRIENYDGKARGKVDMQVVLSESLNTGAVYAMQQLGKEDFLRYLKSFGLDKKTNIDLPDEVEGHISNLSSFKDIEFATASYGQGIAISPIEFCVAASALANGGFLVEPYVVEKIFIEGGTDYEKETKIREQVLKNETAKEISRMLVNVVDDALLGGTVKLDRYSIAAKTGTALLPKKGGGGYYDDDYLHSFFGYAPAFDSRFLVFLYLEKPQGVKYASHTLTDPFMKIMKFLLNYYSVPPDR